MNKESSLIDKKKNKFSPKEFIKRTTPNIVATTTLGTVLTFNSMSKKFSKFSNVYIFLRTANAFAIPSLIYFSTQEILRQYKGELSFTNSIISGTLAGSSIGIPFGIKGTIIASILGGITSGIGFYSYLYFLKWKYSTKLKIEKENDPEFFYIKTPSFDKTLLNLKERFTRRK